MSRTDGHTERREAHNVKRQAKAEQSRKVRRAARVEIRDYGTTDHTDTRRDFARSCRNPQWADRWAW